MRGGVMEMLRTDELVQQTAHELVRLPTDDLVQTLVRTLLDGAPGDLDVPGDLDASIRDLITRTLSVGEMHALYDRGATLDEVGTQAGITAERVSELFEQAGLRTRSKAQTDELKRQAIARRAHERRDALVQGFRDGRNATALAEEHKLPVYAVREILEAEIPAHEYRALRRGPVPKRYADHELLGFLRKAGAARRGVLTVALYNDFAKGRHTADRRPWPTHQTHKKRFGGWLNALHAAGIEANAPHPWGGKTIRADQCIDAIRAVHRKLGRTPTSHEYTRCARDSKGQLPSLATIRNRHDSWLAALHAAEHEPT
jgi:hypothetical protein